MAEKRTLSERKLRQTKRRVRETVHSETNKPDLVKDFGWRRGPLGHDLLLAQYIVIALGGRLWIESDGKDKGTTIWFRLPTKRTMQTKADQNR